MHFLEVAEVSKASIRGFTVMQRACIDGLDDFVEALLDAGVDPNRFTRENGWKPVLWAASRGHYQVLKVLKRANAQREKSLNRTTGVRGNSN